MVPAAPVVAERRRRRTQAIVTKMHTRELRLVGLDAGLLLLGAAALVYAAVQYDWLAQSRLLHAEEALLLAAVVLGSALALARPIGLAWEWGLIGGLAAVHCALLGPAPVAATLLLLVAAAALGSLFLPADVPGRGLLSVVIGLAVIAGLCGWLLPLPVHGPIAYTCTAVLLIALRWRALWALRPRFADRFDPTVRGPRLLALLLIGYGGTSAWLPTVQFDDLVYHLALPTQLHTLGYYRFDVAGNAWALAPWATDVLQAWVQVLAGQEARGALNLAWFLLLLGLCWTLLDHQAVAPRWRWLALAAIASLPFSHSLLQSMQTELPTAVVVIAIVLLVRQAQLGRAAALVPALSVLAGSALAMKVSTLAFLGPLVLWFLLSVRPLPWRAMPAGLALVLAVAGSSYTYAHLLTGNPVLPLFNDWFRSPHFPATPFTDPRYMELRHWLAPWYALADSSRYNEGLDGAAGVQWLLFAPAWLVLGLGSAGRRIELGLVLLLALPLFVQMPYLRYLYPVMVLALCWLVVLLAARSWSGWWWVLWLAVGLNLAVLGNAIWTMQQGTLHWPLTHGERYREAFLRQYAPERLAAAALLSAVAEPRVLLAKAEGAEIAEWGGRAYTVLWHDPETHRAWQQALALDRVADYRALWRALGLTHLLTRRSGRPPGLAAALDAHATLVWALGEVEVHRLERAWRPPTEPPTAGAPLAGAVQRFLWTEPLDGPHRIELRASIRCAPTGGVLMLSYGRATHQGDTVDAADYPRCPASGRIEWQAPVTSPWFVGMALAMTARPVPAPGEPTAELAVDRVEAFILRDRRVERDLGRRFRP